MAPPTFCMRVRGGNGKILMGAARILIGDQTCAQCSNLCRALRLAQSVETYAVRRPLSSVVGYVAAD